MSQGTRRHLTPDLSQETLGDPGSQNARQRLVPGTDRGSAAQGNTWFLPGPDEVSIKVESPVEDEGLSAKVESPVEDKGVSAKVESPVEDKGVSAKDKPRTEPRHRFTFHSRVSKKKPLQAASLEQTEPGTPRVPSLAESEPDGLDGSGPPGGTLPQPRTEPERSDNPRPQQEVISDVESLQPEDPVRLRLEGLPAEVSSVSSWLTDQESLRTPHLGNPSILEELATVREAQQSLELSLLGVAEHHQQELVVLEELLQDERQRSRWLQVQLHDLMDLHQNELNNLKDNLANLEEKIAYQSYESSRDIWEALETIQSKLLRLEQVSQADSPDRPSSHELLGKSMNLLLMLATMALLLMSTLFALILPFVRTQKRALTTCALCLLLLWVWGNWDSFQVQSASPKFLQG